jgi:DNA-binding NarL/FixJ family response regulator
MKPASNDPKSPYGQSRILPRVLIADQSAAVIERLVTTINDVAQVVGRATTAQDAISTLSNAHPHLTIFDVAIPNGVDLLKQIKSHPSPVIAVVLTHSVEDTTRRYCLRLGAEFFLDKLGEFEKVREIVIAVGSGWGKLQ